MKNSELIRSKAFWLIDNLTRGKKRKHYNEIKFLIENPTSYKAIDQKKEILKNLLEHAIKTTSFYSSFNIENRIEKFPIINKNIIRDNFENFQSQEFIDKPKYEAKTSGSTGTPFLIYHDRNKKNRSIADNIYFSEQAGFVVGCQLTYFRFWKAFEQKNAITKWIQNIVPIDVFSLGKKEVMEDVLLQLKKSSATNGWLGYASAFEDICKYMENEKIEPIPNKLKSVISISERLNEHTKRSIKKYFNADVFSRYSNVENGILAQQVVKDKDYFVLNEASYYFEIMNMNSDVPVENGTLGRIVITDLFNYRMPLIRYDTGDIGVKSRIEGKAVLTSIGGRRIDMLTNTKGEIISVNLVLIVNKYNQLKQCQLVQKTTKKYCLILNCDGIFIKEKELIIEFKDYLGTDAQIEVKYVNEIPLLASGKRRSIVNEMEMSY